MYENISVRVRFGFSEVEFVFGSGSPTLLFGFGSCSLFFSFFGFVFGSGSQKFEFASGLYAELSQFNLALFTRDRNPVVLCEYSKIRIRIRYFLVSYRTSIPWVSKLRVLEIIESCHLCVINLSKLSLFEELIF